MSDIIDIDVIHMRERSMPRPASSAPRKRKNARALRRTSGRGRALLAKLPSDPVVSARLTFATKTLVETGRLAGARTKRMSARIDPGLLAAARAKTGLKNDSELISAALAVIAASDDFGPWFVLQAGRLPKDFELDF